jgi:chromosomal replication initiator protein
MATLESRLRSRFEWGLITDIQAPDLEMRLAILEAKAVAHGMDLSYAVLERIARLVPTNIRELEGALTKVVAHASLIGVRLTPDKVDAFLADMVPPRAQVEPEVVLALVARECGISLDQLTGPARKRELVQARQIAMYLLRNLLGMSYAGIGALFGGRDHATVIHSVEKVDTQMLTDDTLQRQIETLKGQLTSPQLVYERIRG